MSIFLGGTTSSNELDDYEEGSWTPVLKDAASGGNTYSGGGNWTTWANYIKVGSMVRVYLNAYGLSNTGMTGGNQIFIHGFPFQANGTQTTFCNMAYFDNVSNTQFGIFMQLNNASSVGRIGKHVDNSNGNQSVNWGHIKTQGYFNFNFILVYRTNS
tara:strand:+ start:94 stop:564 length:471 start_codon:yes stop_codon:yes gene_type:complete